MTIYWEIPLEVTLHAPWAIPGDAAAAPSFDLRLARTGDGRLYLPGTLIRGMFRAALSAIVAEGLAAGADAGALLKDGFGTESAPDTTSSQNSWQTSNAPRRGRLIFGDLLCENRPGYYAPNVARVSRVAIDPCLGAAKEGHLLFVEAPFAVGTPVSFNGKLLVISGADPQADIKLLQKAAGRIFALGGMKSAGFGRVDGDWVIGVPSPVDPAPVDAIDSYVADRAVGLRYGIDRPFLVNASRHRGNLMVGADVIPGAAIKGVLARAATAGGIALDDDFLSATTFTCARAAQSGGSACKPLPLSLTIADGKLWCSLGQNQVESGHYHKFVLDWKSEDKSRAHACLLREFGDGWQMIEPRHRGRSRTAIDGDSLGAKMTEEGGALFSQVLVEPDGFEWVGEIRFSDSAGKDEIATVLSLLKAGVPGLGKSRAVICSENMSRALRPSIPDDKILNLCLLAQACLLDPAKLRAGKSAREAYDDYFSALKLKLEDHASDEALRGGYLALRYPPETGGYAPWLVTLPGSVFCLRRDGITDEALVDILACGLPPAACYQGDWRTMPFLRENGFGQVANNILDHTRLQHGISLQVEGGT